MEIPTYGAPAFLALPTAAAPANRGAFSRTILCFSTTDEPGRVQDTSVVVDILDPTARWVQTVWRSGEGCPEQDFRSALTSWYYR